MRTEPECEEGNFLPMSCLGLEDLFRNWEDHLTMAADRRRIQ